MASFKDATRRAFVGPRAVITCISKEGEEYWIHPRKLSAGVADQIAELQRAYLRENRDSIRGYRQFEEQLEKEGKKIEEANPLELLNFVPCGDPEMRPAIYRLAFADGIGEHNLVGDDGKTICGGNHLDKATIDFIVSWDPLAMELFDIIQRYNLPLPSGSKATSSKPQNGLSSEFNSQRAPSSPMDGSPQK